MKYLLTIIALFMPICVFAQAYDFRSYEDGEPGAGSSDLTVISISIVAMTVLIGYIIYLKTK